MKLLCTCIFNLQHLYHLAFQYTLNSNSEINKVEEYGWYKDSKGKLYFKWDSGLSGTTAKQMLQGEKGCGCKKATCNPKSKSQCVNCYWNCRPCGIKCKCSGSACTNPHNTGIGCDRCKSSKSIVGEESSDIDHVASDIDHVDHELEGNDSIDEEYDSSEDESDEDCGVEDYVGRPLLSLNESEDGLSYDNQTDAL